MKFRFTCVYFCVGLFFCVCLYHPSSHREVVIIFVSLFASPWKFSLSLLCISSWSIQNLFWSLVLFFFSFLLSLPLTLLQLVLWLSSRLSVNLEVNVCCAFHVVFGWIFNSYTLWGFQFSWWDVAHVFKLLFQPTNLDCIKYKMR